MNLKDNKLVEIYFYIIVFLKIIELTSIIPTDNFINTFMIIMGVLLLCYTIVKNELKIKYIYPTELKLYIIGIIITLLLNYNILTLKSVIFQIFYILILFLLAQKFFNEKIYKNIKRIILFVTFFLITLFYIQYIIYGNNVIFKNINGGGLLVALNIFLLVLMKTKNKKMYLLNCLLIVYYVIFMGISNARTSILALIIVCFIYTMKKILAIKYMKSIIIMLMIPIILLGINHIFSKPNVEMEIASIEKKVNSMLSNRYYLWKYGIYNLEDHFLFGIGADIEGKVIEKVPTYILDTQSGFQKWILSRTDLHNGYIQILVQNGVVGLVLIVVYLYNELKKVELKDEKKYLLIFIILMNLCENALLLADSLIVIILWTILGFCSNHLVKPEQQIIGEVSNE